LTYVKSLFPLVILLSLLFGCSNDKNYYNLIATEKTLPTNSSEIVFERKTSPSFQYFVRIATNQTEYEETWYLYGFESKIPNVDLNEDEVFFIGVYESGSCPYKIKNIEMSSDNKTITVPLTEPKGVCTADATPRTFVLELDKEVSKGIENLVIVQSGVETSIPIEN
jgi:hypothetical protein